MLLKIENQQELSKFDEVYGIDRTEDMIFSEYPVYHEIDKNTMSITNVYNNNSVHYSTDKELMTMLDFIGYITKDESVNDTTDDNYSIDDVIADIIIDRELSGIDSLLLQAILSDDINKYEVLRGILKKVG
jgi:hypothetical protein